MTQHYSADRRLEQSCNDPFTILRASVSGLSTAADNLLRCQSLWLSIRFCQARSTQWSPSARWQLSRTLFLLLWTIALSSSNSTSSMGNRDPPPSWHMMHQTPPISNVNLNWYPDNIFKGGKGILLHVDTWRVVLGQYMMIPKKEILTKTARIMACRYSISAQYRPFW